MNSIVGSVSLMLAVVAAMGAVAAAVAAGRFESRTALRMAHGGLAAVAGLFTLASIALLRAFLGDDFSLQYVASYSEAAMPTGYKLAAFWAGQPGSLLLWAWMLAVMSVIAVWTYRTENMTEAATVAATLALACGFFAVLMLFTPDELGRLGGGGQSVLRRGP